MRPKLGPPVAQLSAAFGFVGSTMQDTPPPLFPGQLDVYFVAILEEQDDPAKVFSTQKPTVVLLGWHHVQLLMQDEHPKFKEH